MCSIARRNPWTTGSMRSTYKNENSAVTGIMSRIEEHTSRIILSSRGIRETEQHILRTRALVPLRTPDLPGVHAVSRPKKTDSIRSRAVSNPQVLPAVPA